MRQTELIAQCLESLFTVWNCTGVTPDNGRTQNPLIFIHTDKSMHLIGYTDSGYLILLYSTLRHYRLCSPFQIIPPHFRMLFRPSRMNGNNLRFRLRIKSRSYTFTGFSIYQTGLHRRTTDIVSKQIHTHSFFIIFSIYYKWICQTYNNAPHGALPRFLFHPKAPRMALKQSVCGSYAHRMLCHKPADTRYATGQP